MASDWTATHRGIVLDHTIWIQFKGGLVFNFTVKDKEGKLVESFLWELDKKTLSAWLRELIFK